jgi:prophage regulatory protein
MQYRLTAPATPASGTGIREYVEVAVMKLLKLKEVIQLTGLSRTTIYRYEANSVFPKRRRTGPNSVRWLDSEVNQWMESRPVMAESVNLGPRSRKVPR